MVSRGLVGVWGESSSLAGGGASLKEEDVSWGWVPRGDGEGVEADDAREEDANADSPLCFCCCCCPKAENVPEEKALNPPLPVPNPVAPPAANAPSPPFVLAGLLTEGFVPNPLCPNPLCPNPLCPNAERFCSVPTPVFAVEPVPDEPKLPNTPNPVAGFNSPPPAQPPKVVVVVGATEVVNGPNMLFFCCASLEAVLELASSSPRLSERPPKDVSSPIEASLGISEGGGEALGVAFVPNPKPSWPNGLGLEAGKELNAADGLPKALGVEDVLNVPVPNALFVMEPNALGVEPNAREAPPNALGDEEANAPNPDVGWEDCPKAGWEDWLLNALKAGG